MSQLCSPILRTMGGMAMAMPFKEKLLGNLKINHPAFHGVEDSLHKTSSSRGVTDLLDPQIL